MAKLLAQFEAERTKVGVITLMDSGGITITFLSALGKAANDDAATHNNPGAIPLYPYGDTPTGDYNVISVVPSGPGTNYDVHKFGDVGVIRLDPLSGDALTAKSNGRRGLLIHGGDPGKNTLLRRTNGCIRMMNTELQQLIADMSQLQIQGDPVTVLTVQEIGGVGTGACDDNGTCDEGDPPPM